MIPLQRVILPGTVMTVVCLLMLYNVGTMASLAGANAAKNTSVDVEQEESKIDQKMIKTKEKIYDNISRTDRIASFGIIDTILHLSHESALAGYRMGANHPGLAKFHGQIAPAVNAIMAMFVGAFMYRKAKMVIP